jgi:hypothetical protein
MCNKFVGIKHLKNPPQRILWDGLIASGTIKCQKHGEEEFNFTISKGARVIPAAWQTET